MHFRFCPFYLLSPFKVHFKIIHRMTAKLGRCWVHCGSACRYTGYSKMVWSSAFRSLQTLKSYQVFSTFDIGVLGVFYSKFTFLFHKTSGIDINFFNFLSILLSANFLDIVRRPETKSRFPPQISSSANPLHYVTSNDRDLSGGPKPNRYSIYLYPRTRRSSGSIRTTCTQFVRINYSPPPHQHPTVPLPKNIRLPPPPTTLKGVCYPTPRHKHAKTFQNRIITPVYLLFCNSRVWVWRQTGAKAAIGS